MCWVPAAYSQCEKLCNMYICQVCDVKKLRIQRLAIIMFVGRYLVHGCHITMANTFHADVMSRSTKDVLLDTCGVQSVHS